MKLRYMKESHKNIAMGLIKGHYEFCNKQNVQLDVKSLAKIIGVSIASIYYLAYRMKIIKADRTVNNKEVKYIIDKETNCWNWQLYVADNGYGLFTITKPKKETIMAHRYIFLQTYPNIDITNLDLDHLCRNRRCVNPKHLEPVTRKENLRRGREFKRLSN